MNKKIRYSIAFSVAVFCLAAAPFSKISKIELRPIFHKRFKQPVFVTPYPAPDARCPDAHAIVEKPGLIRIESPAQSCGVTLLDIRERVADPTLEEGLLGLAFAPDFTASGRYYIYYSAAKPRRTILARVEKEKLTEIFSIRQPFSNHNGGMLEFGPDGFLYIGVGDGGSGGDPRGYAQNDDSLLGKILRWREGMKRPEIFAKGLRNPWRFSFTPDGRLVVADVGQDDYEELSFADRGDNMGWNVMESFHCFKPRKGCDQKGLKLPFFEYDHGQGQSILGGYVYTGKAMPSLFGRYIFADSISGRVWALNYKIANSKAELLIQTPGLFSSFGRLRSGELVIAELQTGKISLLAPSGQVGLE